MTIIDDDTNLGHLPWESATRLAARVQVCKISEPFEVELQGQPPITGKAGDYLIREPAGALLKCTANEFTRLYVIDF